MALTTKIEGPVAVIGDVHGHVDKLVTILERLRDLPDYDRRWIVFIGDLVDRGPDPKGAVDIVTDLLIEHPNTTMVSGNHEFAMAASLNLLPTPDYSNWADRWTDHYGSETTFESYGVPFSEIDELAAALPQSHRDLLSDLPWCVDHPDHFFVHAGLDPNMDFKMQRKILKARDYSLNRPQWLCSKSLVTAEMPADCKKLVVSGHVKVPEVRFGRNRLLIDTTGGFDGDLSCVLLPERKVITSGSGRRRSSAASAPVATSKSRGWFGARG